MNFWVLFIFARTAAACAVADAGHGDAACTEVTASADTSKLFMLRGVGWGVRRTHVTKLTL